MVSVGTAPAVVARAIGVSEATLYRHFEHELKNGRAEIHATIGNGIAAMALAHGAFAPAPTWPGCYATAHRSIPPSQ